MVKALSIVVVIAALFFFVKSVLTNKFNPAPTERFLNHEEKKQFKKDRLEWIEDMHRSAQDDDWRTIDRKTRIEKNKIKLQQRENLSRQGAFLKKGSRERFAKSSLTGTWQERGSHNQAGRILTAEVDFEDGLIYAGSDGGNIWIGNLDGFGWTSINDYLKFSGINMVRLISTQNGKRLVVAENKNVYYTDDEGLIWKTSRGLDTFENWGSIRQGLIANDADKTIYLYGQEWDYINWHEIKSIYRSTSQGRQFTKIYTLDGLTNLYDLWTSRYQNTGVYLLKKNTLYKLNDGNPLEKISTIEIPFSISNVSDVAITASSDASHFYVAFINNGQAYIYGSDDAGHSWTARGTVTTSLFTRRSFACSATNFNNLYIGNIDAFRSWDGGSSWTKVNHWGDYYENPATKLHADIPELTSFIDPDSIEQVYISTDGGLYVSGNSCKTVANLSLQGLHISQYYSTFTTRDDGEVIYAGAQDQGFQRIKEDNGGLLNFEQVYSGDYGHISSGNEGKSIWYNYPGFTVYMPFARLLTVHKNFDFSPYKNHLWLPPIIEHPFDPKKAFLAAGTSTSGSHLWELTYNGAVNAVEGSFDFSAGDNSTAISAMGYDQLNRNYIYVLTNTGNFFVSSDTGATWQQSIGFDGPGSHYFYGAKIVGSPIKAGQVYVGGSGYSNPGAYVSNDYGKTFSAITEGLPGTLIYDMDINPAGTVLYAATEVGPYAYVDSLDEWFDISGNYAPDQTYWSVEFIPVLNTARFATYGRGIWDFKVETATAINEKPKLTMIPSQFVLKNYPNPFNGSTRISYKINQSAKISLKIYDISGRMVKHLVDENKLPGQHSVMWNGRNDNGNVLSSGTYFYSLYNAERRLAVQKLIMLK